VTQSHHDSSSSSDLIESKTFLKAKALSDRIWGSLKEDASKYRMLTGDRPTGPLHIGHYFGSLANRIKLQQMGIDSFIVVADYQVLTDRDDVGQIQRHVRDLILDYASVGLNPFEHDNTTIFCHSQIPELNQLILPFSTLVSVSELQKNPTIKEEAQAMKLSTISACMLTYPIHQAADILFCHGQLVPVGKDQLPHLELSRKIARRFNERYSPKSPVFREPTALLAEVPLISGLDGSQKMSKSRNNTINLSMTERETTKAIKRAKTDADRVITYDPINRPEVSNLLTLLSLCTDRSPESWAEEIGDGGGGTLKNCLADHLNEFLAPMRDRRSEFEARPDFVHEVLEHGTRHAREVAIETLDTVRSVMQMNYSS
jgi:tryptophanyl-tRNA synthetase